jgi:hypothetical protein
VQIGNTNYLQPGSGAFFRNASASTVTIPTVGQVIQGTNYYSIPAGQNIYSIPQPLAGLSIDNPQVNFPVVSTKTFYLQWTGSGFNQYEYYNCADSGGVAAGFYNLAGTVQEDTNTAIWPQAGGSFFIRNASSGTTWTNVFEVQ